MDEDTASVQADDGIDAEQEDGGGGTRNDGPARPGVAAFDFDGTLSRQDTMVPFLVRTHGRPRMAIQALLASPRALRGLKASGGLRDSLKVATVGRLFKGMPQKEYDDRGASYAESILDLLQDETLERLRWHQGEGHDTVIVSASLATYLRPVAAELGVDHVLAVELTADDRGFLTGEIDGGVNTRGTHKVTRLRAWLDDRFGPDTPVELWAYGDSSGDRELLAAADHPTWVGSRS